MQTIFIRADGDREIGYGHLLRCSILTRRLSELGFKSIWITSDPRKIPWGFFGFGPFKCFDCKSRELSGVESIKLAGAKKDDWVILDSNILDASSEKAYKSMGLNVLTIDDSCRRGFSADLVLNGNPIAKNLSYKGNKGTRFLLGQGYYMLREDIRKNKPRTRSYPPNHGLINWGSDNPDRLTERILKIIEGIKLNWTVILPPDYTGSKPTRSNINLIQGLVPLSSYINACDLYIGTVDNTIFEVIYSLMPSVIVSTNDDQYKLAEKLNADKVALFLGRSNKVIDKIILMALERVLKGDHKDQFSSIQGYIDGDGVNRVIKEMKLV